MKNRLMAVVVGAALSVSLIATSSAFAATEFGDGCIANRTTESESLTLLQIASPQSGLPSAAPTAGVITKWKLNLITPEGEPIPAIIPQTFKVLRLNTGAKMATTIGEDTKTVGSGLNTFDVRIPVAAGDRLGLFGPSGATSISTLFCETPNPGNSTGAIEGGAPSGSTNSYVEIPEAIRVPVAAVLEPDADNDGFGDETQDKCPQSAALQIPCPVVALSTSASARKGLANVLVTSSFQAPVTVAGTVKLGKGKTAKINGGTQIVTPGVIAKFTLLFPQKLKAKLKGLSRKRFLWLSLTASAPNVVGAPTVSSLKVKLRGQAKPKPKKPRRQAKS
jgi:hypothetical protein